MFILLFCDSAESLIMHESGLFCSSVVRYKRVPLGWEIEGAGLFMYTYGSASGSWNMLAVRLWMGKLLFGLVFLF